MPEVSGIKQMARAPFLQPVILALLVSGTYLAETRIRRKRCSALVAETFGCAWVGPIAYKLFAGISFLARE